MSGDDSAPAPYRSVIIEADGGCRGNPGPASYGAVLKDADTGAVIAEDATTIGVATNNVAEYSGLIAGLELAQRFAPDAEIEVRMDSKLVVEQMSGRWKIKHPAMRPLAMEANQLAPFGTVYTWIPREQNKHADRLANEALDGTRSGVSVPGEEASTAPEPREPAEPREPSEPREPAEPAKPTTGWGPVGSSPTTLILVRHGETPYTREKRFSGGLNSANPGLSEDGRAQVVETARWLAPLAERVDTLIASPVRRTRESAEIIAETMGLGTRGLDIEEEPGFAEMEFGRWDGLTFAEVQDRHPDEIEAWMASLDHAPGGGESFRLVEQRVLSALDSVLSQRAGQTVLVVSHVTPIKTLVAHALGAGLDGLFRLELSPATVSTIAYHRATDRFPERASLRLFNAAPGGTLTL